MGGRLGEMRVEDIDLGGVSKINEARIRFVGEGYLIGG